MSDERICNVPLCAGKCGQKYAPSSPQTDFADRVERIVAADLEPADKAAALKIASQLATERDLETRLELAVARADALAAALGEVLAYIELTGGYMKHDTTKTNACILEEDSGRTFLQQLSMYYVSQRSVMSDAMRRDYDRAEEHLVVLMDKAQVRR